MESRPGGALASDRRDLLLATLALAMGIAYDLLFHGRPAGISYPLFLAVWMAYMFRGLGCRFVLRPDFGLFLLAAAALLSLTFALFANPVLRALNMAVVPVLAVMYIEQAAGLHESRVWGPDRISAALRRLLVRAIASMPAAIRIPAIRLKQRQDAARYQTMLKITFGLLLSLPIVIVAGVLLSSADMLFQEMLQQVPDWFRYVPVGEIIFRGLVILIAACYIFGLLWSMKKDAGKRDTTEEDLSGHGLERRLGSPAALAFDPVITATVLVSVNAVYVLFTAVQFAYLFGGGDSLLPGGTTYAEYARRGFGEVVFVSILNFFMMLGALCVTKSNTRTASRLIRPLLALLLGNTLVMLVSAFVRLSMYEAAYGYTYTRFFVHAFLLWLGAMLALMLVKIVRPGTRLFRAAFILTAASYIILNYVNMDAIIAGRNIDRYRTDGRIDWHYLNRLSYDAVPVLMKLDEEERSGTPLSQGFEDKKHRLQRESSWPSFNAAKYRARKLLAE